MNFKNARENPNMYNSRELKNIFEKWKINKPQDRIRELVAYWLNRDFAEQVERLFMLYWNGVFDVLWIIESESGKLNRWYGRLDWWDVHSEIFAATAPKDVYGRYNRGKWKNPQAIW